MQELSLNEQYLYDGGNFLGLCIVVSVFGTALLKVLVSNKGKISLPSIITFEWSK